MASTAQDKSESRSPGSVGESADQIGEAGSSCVSASSRKVCRVALCLFFGSFLVYLFTASMEAPFVGDGVVMLEDAVRLLRSPGIGALSLSSKYGIGQTLLYLPAAPFAVLKSGEMNPAVGILLVLLVTCVPAVIGAATNVVLWFCARDLGYSRKDSFLCSLLFGFTSMSWVYTQSLFSEPATGLFLLASFYCVRRGKAASSTLFIFWGGLSGAYAFLIKTTAILPAGVILLVAALSSAGEDRQSWFSRGKRRFLVSALVPWLGALIIAAAYNWVRYGDVLNFGYSAERDAVFGFNTPLLTGLYGLLLSSGKGVLWYSPTLFLALLGVPRVWRRHRNEFLVIAGVTLSVLLPHAMWWAWHGDWCWGPRFLLPTLPFVYLLALPVIEGALPTTGSLQRPSSRRLLAGALIAVSIGVQILGLAAPYHRYIIVSLFNTPVFRKAAYDSDKWPIRDDMAHIHFIPEFSPIAGHLWMLRATWSRNADSAEEVRRNPPWAKLNPQWRSRGVNWESQLRYDVWWLTVWQGRRELGATVVGLLVFAAVLGSGGAGLLGVGWRRTYRSTTVHSAGSRISPA